ncbi:hypothetical protein PGT21_012181 [Puccinia graminis f. sp. tritici]|uniref:Uncharacterized protein n=1 Tax=Puccinia graminis f. sp. tritici TaxID=56615 RepID=A0A5B0MUN0_PUCGR|nr:hypothetical protein PGT21_012181 [Puccinia graminis f. sp. tritici]
MSRDISGSTPHQKETPTKNDTASWSAWVRVKQSKKRPSLATKHFYLRTVIGEEPTPEWRQGAGGGGEKDGSTRSPSDWQAFPPPGVGPVTLEPQPPTHQPVRLRRNLATPKNPSTASTHCHQGSRLQQPSHLLNIQNFH